MVEKTPRAKVKIERFTKAMCHEEPDRIPIFEVYWTSFLKRWREELGLPSEEAGLLSTATFDPGPYYYYDLDVVWAIPNLDPHIGPFEILKESEEETVVRTGYGAIVRKVHKYVMPQYVAFDTDAIDKVRSFTFDDPWDERRFFSRGDDHLNGVGDSLIFRDTAPWIDRVKALVPEFAVIGGVIEANEFMTRSIGQENALLWMGLYPDEIGRFAERINEFMLEILKAQIKAADGMLEGVMIAGDVAYTGGMLFSPDYWRKYFKPGLKAMVEATHDAGLLVFLHACSDNRLILDDCAEIGVDSWHPVEWKARQDVVELRRKMGHRLAFVGNNDVRLWTEGNKEKIKAHMLRKFNAAKGGGYLFGADHSVPPDVSVETYEYVLNLVRQHGNYPLRLGEYDIPDIHQPHREAEMGRGGSGNCCDGLASDADGIAYSILQFQQHRRGRPPVSRRKTSDGSHRRTFG